MQLIFHSNNINLLSRWEKSVDCEYKILYELNELKSIMGELVIVNYSAIEFQDKEIIETLHRNNNIVIILHETPNIKTAKKVLSYGAKAYGNTLMKAHFITSAINTVKDGLIWLHPEITSQLINQIPVKKERDILWILDKLTSREKEVALLLKDGNTYKMIGDRLGITPRTIKAHAQSIYTKLHVKDKLALALLLK